MTTQKDNLVGGPEALVIFAMTLFLVLSPLVAVVGGLISWMSDATWSLWAIIPIGILAFLFAVAIWLVIIGYILGKMTQKANKD